MKKKYLLSALAVALSLGANTAPAFIAIQADNQTVTIDALNERLMELNAQCRNIQARADAEQRHMTDDEQREFDNIYAEFERVTADIARRERMEQMNSRLSTPNSPRSLEVPTESDDPAPVAAPTRAQAAAAPRILPASAGLPNAQLRDNRDAGKWGFRNQGEYLVAVMKAASKGGSVDPRLIANAPSTYGQEGVGQDGGFAVPPDFRSAIVAKVMGEDSLLSRTDQMTTNSNAVTVPIDHTTPWQSTGGIQATWEGEAGAIGQSKPQLKDLTVKANKLTALVPLTDELISDAPSMASYVGRKAPEKIGFKINDAIINGLGNGMPLGILKSAGTVTVAAESGQVADTVVYNNIVNMWTRMAAGSRRNAVWVVNGDIEAQLMTMSFPGSGTAVPVYLPPGGLSASPYGTLLGRPVVTTEAAPALGSAGDILFADMSKYMSVVKTGGIRQDISIHLWFDQDVVAFRFIIRVGGQPWFNEPIERLAGQASRGFFIALGERS